MRRVAPRSQEAAHEDEDKIMTDDLFTDDGPSNGKENVPPPHRQSAPAALSPRGRPAFTQFSQNDLNIPPLHQGVQMAKHASNIFQPPQFSLFSHPYSCSSGEQRGLNPPRVPRRLSLWHFEMQEEEDRPVQWRADSYFCSPKRIRMDDDPLLDMTSVSPYAMEILQVLRNSEMTFRPNPYYLLKHPALTSTMRANVVDWLTEITLELRFSGETLHLAVNYLDRFLSATHHVPTHQLQLISITALILAAKYEERLSFQLDGFVNEEYTKEHLIQMERTFLSVLEYNLTAPTCHQYVRQLVSIHRVCPRTQLLAMFLVDLSLLDVEPFLRYGPSVVAAAAFCLAGYTVSRDTSCFAMLMFTGFTSADIAPCLMDLLKVYIGASHRDQQTITDKYKSPAYYSVSLIPPPAQLAFY